MCASDPAKKVMLAIGALILLATGLGCGVAHAEPVWIGTRGAPPALAQVPAPNVYVRAVTVLRGDS
jgi:hypothetical protein